MGFLKEHPVIKYVGVFLLVEYLITLGVIPCAEGWSFFDATWWFIVTVTTVGYGDLSNATAIGRVWGIIVILSGVFCMASLGGTLLEIIIDRRNNKMRGNADFSGEEGHIIIMAGKCVETVTHLIDTLLADKLRKNRRIIVCSNDMEFQPDTRADFVRGELTSADVMARCGVEKADRVIVHTGNDHENVFTAMAIQDSDDNDPVHMVVHLSDPANERHLKRMNSRNNISVVADFSNDLIVRESQDKGTARLIQSLASNQVAGHNIYRIEVSGEVHWSDVKKHFMRHYANRPEVILLGAEDHMNGQQYIGNVPPTYLRAVLVISPERITLPKFGG